MADSGTGGSAQRRARILELIAARPVETQEELAAQLQREGFAVTQATVSRDVRELRLVKVPTGLGGHRYAPAAPAPSPPALSEAMLRRLLHECVTNIDFSENLVVVSTLPGTAQTVAEAVDALRAPEAIGTLNGERTVFVVIKPRRAVPAFLARLRGLAAAPGEPEPPP